jgi:hypothetical protein
VAKKRDYSVSIYNSRANSKQSRTDNDTSANGHVVTVATLAKAKGLDPAWLARELGLTDLPGGGISIPYFDIDGTESFRRERDNPARDRRFHQPAGVKLRPYGLWQLGDARRAGHVYLAEGESDAWSLWSEDLPALGIPGAHSDGCITAEDLSGIDKIYLLPDADQAGEQLVEGLARRLTKLGWQGQLWRVPLPDGIKDVSDWRVRDSKRFLGELAEAVKGAKLLGDHHDVGNNASTPHVASPDAGPAWPDPLAPEAFYGLAGEIVHALEPASEADPAALLFQLLIAFGNVIGRNAHFAVEADQHFANEFVVLVGRTAKGRKGTSWGQINRLLEFADEQWVSDRVQTGLSSGEGLIWAVRDPIVTRQAVKEKGRVTGHQEVETDPGIADKRLLVVEPEFASVLKQTERQGNVLSAVVRQAWESGNLRTMTKNNPARATGAHVSLIGHCTCEELRRYLSVTEMANGFGNRFLWACVQRSKVLPEGGSPDADALADLKPRLAEAITFARRGRVVERDEKARGIWHEVYGPLSEGKPGLAGALLARAEAHVMRLAMIYALMDRSAVIQAPHLLAALALWVYVEKSVHHVFGDSLGDSVADDLLRLLRASPAGLTRNDLMNYFGRHLPSGRIGQALGLLLQQGLVRCEQQQTGGRPAERWFAANRTSE